MSFSIKITNLCVKYENKWTCQTHFPSIGSTVQDPTSAENSCKTTTEGGVCDKEHLNLLCLFCYTCLYFIHFKTNSKII